MPEQEYGSAGPGDRVKAVPAPARLPAFDPCGPDLRVDPYPWYARYRAHDPLHRCRLPDGRRAWYLFRHRDVTRALRDPRFVREARRVYPPEAFPPIPESQRQFWQTTDLWILFRDPPTHTRLRALLGKAFTPPMVEGLRPRIAAVAEDLLRGLRDRREADLLGDFASPLPIIVIAEVLGVPPEDRQLIRAWSLALTNALDVPATPDGYEAGSRATGELTAYLRQIVAARRRRPRNDLISDLIAAEASGEGLSEEELLANCVLLVFAGHETTVNLLGNGMLALLRHPAQLELLRSRPADARDAVEEMLRYDCPVQFARRLAAEDVDLGEQAVRQGDQVRLMLGSANRDPEVYPDPDRFDLRRGGPQHSAFGMGIHFCLGAPLARAEAAIAITTLLARFPSLRLRDEPLAWRETVGLRGLTRLPVAL